MHLLAVRHRARCRRAGAVLARAAQRIAAKSAAGGDRSGPSADSLPEGSPMPQMLLAALVLAAAEAPVTEVTVYSDRARVVRTARVPVSGTQAIALPPLRDRIDISTLRVEVTGAELVRVDLKPLTPDEFPVDEGRKLLEQLEKLDDRLALARSQRDSHLTQAETLLQLEPKLPEETAEVPLPKLESSAWPATVAWMAEESARL